MSEEVWVKKKKRGTRTWVIPLVILPIFTFTGVAIWLQYVTGLELSPTLITCFYGFCTGELWLLASITKTKVKNKENTISNEDNYPRGEE